MTIEPWKSRMTLRGWFRWWWLVPAIVVVVMGSWLARAKLSAWTRARLAEEEQAVIASLPEGQAAEMVRRLPEIGDEGLEVLAFALADKRQEVTAAARSALIALLTDWQDLPIDERSLQAERLASALADQAPKLSPDALVIAQYAARLLLSWPANGRRIDAAALIANCESILRLETDNLAEVGGAEVRLGALPSIIANGDRVQ
jgi:hypothetical protein